MVSHLRSLFEHHGLLPHRDEYLARFEIWLAAKLDTIAEPAVRAPVEQFATWHHLRRLRANSTPGQASERSMLSAKQQVTETIRLLTWLYDTHHRTAADCRQQDLDEWLASGPTTRHKTRAFFAWANKSKINTAVRFVNQQPKHVPVLTQEQRLTWIKALLTGNPGSLHYRVAGLLLLLYAQPLVKIAALPATAVTVTTDDVRISLGNEPLPVPEPFACILVELVHRRPNLRTGGGGITTPWLFPAHRPGKHLDAMALAHDLTRAGVSVLAARNSALRTLVAEMPPPIVAKLLGFSDNCVQRHAQLAAQPWSRYVT